MSPPSTSHRLAVSVRPRATTRPPKQHASSSRTSISSREQIFLLVGLDGTTGASLVIGQQHERRPPLQHSNHSRRLLPPTREQSHNQHKAIPSFPPYSQKRTMMFPSSSNVWRCSLPRAKPKRCTNRLNLYHSRKGLHIA